MRKGSSYSPGDRSGPKKSFSKSGGKKDYKGGSKPFKRNESGQGKSGEERRFAPGKDHGHSGDSSDFRKDGGYKGRDGNSGGRSFRDGGAAGGKPRSFDKPYEDRKRSGDKPFGERSGGDSSRSRSFDKPFSDRKRTDDRPFRDRGDDGGKSRSFDKPFSGDRNRSSNNDRPPRDRDNEDRGKSRSFDKPFSGGSNRSSNDRPPRDRDNADRGKSRSFDKPFSGDRARSSNDRPPRDRNDSSESRSFDKPFSRDRNDSRNDKPYSGRTPSGPDRPPRDGDRKPYSGRSASSDKPYSGRSDKSGGEDRPYKDRSKSSFRKSDSARKPYDDAKTDEKPTFKRPFKVRERPRDEDENDQPRREHTNTGKRKTFIDRYDKADWIDDENEIKEEEKMPLNKYIAHSGECSRRDAGELVKQGKVKVNEELVLDPGYKVQPGDQVTLSGKKLKPQKGLIYILLNKPKGYITTNDDPQGRRTVMQLVTGAEADRLFPVGRLDRNTSGLLLITNDGDLTQKLSHPSYDVKKVYHVTLDKNMTQADFDKVIAGVELEDGIAKVDEIAFLESKNEIGLEIHSGKNRIVRRIFESLGYVVEKLDRMMYAGLTKKNLPRGKWRLLDEREIVLLKHFKS